MRYTGVIVAAALVATISVQPATASDKGRASGTIDGQSLDLAIDCSNWGDDAYPSVSAVDQNAIFDGTRFPDGKFALTWKPGDHRYQLLFSEVEARESIELRESFKSKKLGRSFDAQLTIDCTG